MLLFNWWINFKFFCLSGLSFKFLFIFLFLNYKIGDSKLDRIFFIWVNNGLFFIFFIVNSWLFLKFFLKLCFKWCIVLFLLYKNIINLWFNLKLCMLKLVVFIVVCVLFISIVFVWIKELLV